MSAPTPPASWAHLPFFRTDWPRIAAALEAEHRRVLPPSAQIFAALEAARPEDVRVVILGQDPYPTSGHANGLAFSAASGTHPLPRSLSNIFKELHSDLNVSREECDLSDWAAQGVLLLNTALSVPAGTAGGHAKLGWRQLTEEVLVTLSGQPRAFVLWGAHAQSFRPFITGDAHLVLEAPHPSPLSARRGFFGSRPFSRINAWLRSRGDKEIDWTRT
ncbi:Uracil-DNA glycosylase [Roseivivax sp. THAF40]|uniref:uracil-DNA glycosylase n=1 Tax=unclassified Roseivivax TaxID=2639302 RepID=UPI00126883A7|nr:MULTISPECIES: uracil-DNA glycosylase [unclassified Roseivivax]QFS83373.1 Uracil-DNA glycosylase [Roseivivax sp. THAF197b]QFT47117.1 Uracil-DNA glycosylase [Roseivivax sp. THAF40]